MGAAHALPDWTPACAGVTSRKRGVAGWPAVRLLQSASGLRDDGQGAWCGWMSSHSSVVKRSGAASG